MALAVFTVVLGSVFVLIGLALLWAAVFVFRANWRAAHDPLLPPPDGWVLAEAWLWLIAWGLGGLAFSGIGVSILRYGNVHDMDVAVVSGPLIDRVFAISWRVATLGFIAALTVWYAVTRLRQRGARHNDAGEA